MGNAADPRPRKCHRPPQFKENAAAPRRRPCLDIIPALETAHAISYACDLAPTLRPEDIIIICLSGRGDKDISIVAEQESLF